MIRRDFHDPEISLSQGMGEEKARNENVQPNSVWCCRRRTQESFSTLDSSPQSGKPVSFGTLEIPFWPLLWASSRRKIHRVQMCRWFIQWTRNKGWDEMSEVPRFWATVHWSSSGKECLSFPDSETGEGIAPAAGTRMLLHLLQALPAESHSPPLSKTRHSQRGKGKRGRSQTTLFCLPITTAQRDGGTDHSRP